MVCLKCHTTSRQVTHITSIHLMLHTYMKKQMHTKLFFVTSLPEYEQRLVSFFVGAVNNDRFCRRMEKVRFNCCSCNQLAWQVMHRAYLQQQQQQQQHKAFKCKNYLRLQVVVFAGAQQCRMCVKYMWRELLVYISRPVAAVHHTI